MLRCALASAAQGNVYETSRARSYYFKLDRQLYAQTCVDKGFVKLVNLKNL